MLTSCPGRRRGLAAMFARAPWEGHFPVGLPHLRSNLVAVRAHRAARIMTRQTLLLQLGPFSLQSRTVIQQALSPRRFNPSDRGQRGCPGCRGHKS
jgi:hypothetical protein